MLKSSLCDYSNACIPVKETVTVFGIGTTEASRVTDREDKQAIFKTCAENIQGIIQKHP